MKFPLYILKRRIEDVIMFPLILLGRLVSRLMPLDKEYETFFFFPFYHTGGAEKVHALIAAATGNKNCIVYFTRKSADKTFYNDFVQTGCTIKDISKHTNNKLFYAWNLMYRGIISGYINRQKTRPIVFNGQCNFGYKISPWINNGIPQVELIHSFNTFSWIRIPFIPFYRQTIMISKVRVVDHLEQYKRLGVPTFFSDKILHVVNGIPLPAQPSQRTHHLPLQLLYVGRGTIEKRVHIVAAIAKACADNKLPVVVSFMGEVNNAISPDLIPYCNLLGHKSDPNEIDEIYKSTDVLIITSDTEGFPMVVEEAMARGCAIIATPVGDLTVHIQQGVNGFLFSTIKDEQLIVKEALEFLTLLTANPALLPELSLRNIQYAQENFGLDKFTLAYRKLFDQLRNTN